MRFASILTSFLLAASLPAALPTLHAQTRDTSAKGDEAVLEMAEAFKKGDRKRLAALLPQTRGHLLEPWAAYWELRARLDEAPAAEVQAFFQRYAGSYQEDRLRNDWLLLAGARRDWAAFNAEYPRFRMGDDRSVRCYALLTESMAGADVAAQVQDTWLSLRDADEGCAAAAELLIKTGKLPHHAAWLRARLGMENDRPRVVTQALAMLNPDWAARADTIYKQPARYLDEKLTAILPRTKELVTLAFVRLAQEDPAQAALQLDKLRWKTQLTQEERSWIWGAIGKKAAQRLSDAATAWFAHGQDKSMHEDHLAWKVRAALRAGNWAMVLEATAAMPEPLRRDPAWTYWRARALLAPGRPEADRQEATRLLEGIAGIRGFYEQLALEDLGRKITLPERPPAPTPEEREAARANPGLQRAMHAIAIGLRPDGVREWNYTTNLHLRGGMDDRALLAAADLACQREVWDRCINTSERTRGVIDIAQRFPMPFREAVLRQSQAIGLDPSYVYGLIRQESRFIMDARSSVGASGLMQVMPATARWTARKIGLANFTPSQITDRDTNIAIGTGYLKLVLDDFGGSMPMAAAAYNAGPGRPRAWRNGPLLEAAAWAENVPFNETRDYVKKVVSNATVYAAVISGQPQSIRSRLGTVGPRLGSAEPENTDLP